MNTTDDEKEARLQRQKEELERRAKTRNSRIFLFFGSLFEILETFSIVVILCVFFFILVYKLFKLPESAAATVFQFCMIVSFFGGLFLGFMVYKKCAGFVIEKFNLTNKLSNEVLSHYAKRNKEAEKEELKR